MSKLFVVPTPIGNLADITLRSIDVLKSADLILAEDTRTSSKLLKHYDIETNIIGGAPGVYVDEKKIASIGLRISRGKTYHGISLNVDMDTEPFNQINPCGYEGLKVTQMKDFIDIIDIKSVESLAIEMLGKKL